MAQKYQLIVAGLVLGICLYLQKLLQLKLPLCPNPWGISP
jgi:hypothetical protein